MFVAGSGLVLLLALIAMLVAQQYNILMKFIMQITRNFVRKLKLREFSIYIQQSNFDSFDSCTAECVGLFASPMNFHFQHKQLPFEK